MQTASAISNGVNTEKELVSNFLILSFNLVLIPARLRRVCNLWLRSFLARVNNLCYSDEYGRENN